MKFTKEERLRIGKEIYTYKISMEGASKKYHINFYTAREYMRLYRDTNNLEAMGSNEFEILSSKEHEVAKLSKLSKEELIKKILLLEEKVAK